MLAARPGDVLAVWTGDQEAQKAIRIGDVLEGKPAVANHVIGVTHQDVQGRWMGLEGRPGGFGLADCTPYLNDPRTRSNHFQERTDKDNLELIAITAKMTGTPYDWVGIDLDALDALGLDFFIPVIDKIWRWPSDGNLLPGHVVCSSAWAWAYKRCRLQHPSTGAERTCSPGDWWVFNNRFPAVEA
jgi:hypothetical protein